MVVAMENTTDRDLTYGEAYTLERFVDGSWSDITSELSFDDIAHTIEAGDTVTVTSLESLAAGRYRITTDAGAFGARKTFTVAPAPEPEIDPIVVEMPTLTQASEGVQSPVRIAGTADVYEGTVSVLIKDDAGNVLAEEFTTATCGSGCRGDFSLDVSFAVEAPVFGVIEVYSESAETGEPMHLVEIPANLLPPKSEETPDEGEMAAITVDSHQPGDTMTAPSTVVSGTANTFEANVRIRLLDENGEILVDTFTTATCGTGCRGDYSKKIKFEVDHQQSGTLQVFESSAQDGSEINMVEIPVVLAPKLGGAGLRRRRTRFIRESCRARSSGLSDAARSRGSPTGLKMSSKPRPSSTSPRIRSLPRRTASSPVTRPCTIAAQVEASSS